MNPHRPSDRRPAPGTARRAARAARALALAAVVLLAPALRATTKGLNQIVTPDIQPAGVLSISGQLQDARIGNPAEVQLELGLTRWAEVAAFRGFRPGETIFGAEAALVQAGPHLLTAGLVDWSTRGGGASPILEYGCYAARDHLIAGAIRSDRRTEGILGWSHQLTDRWQVSADYQSGPGNAVTLGATVSLTPDLQLNPAVYFANTRPHRAMGYVVLSWNLRVWR